MLTVLAGCLPIDLILEMELEYNNILNKINMYNTAINLNVKNKDYYLNFSRVEIKYRNKFERRENEVYTDGSKIDNKVGSSIVVFNNTEKIVNKGYRLNDGTTVFMAELYAIDKAVEYIIRKGDFWKEDKNYAIISHSLSALQAIASMKENRSYIVNLRNKINYLNIELYWTKAHVDDAGNEEADIMAKNATTRVDINVKFHKTKYQLRANLDAKYKENWNVR